MAETSPAPGKDHAEDDVRRLLAKIPPLRAEIGKVIIGQQTVIEELLTAFWPAAIV